ncbi:MAG: alpha-glucan family phosphorylase [Verrucomicrobia bacterium]|nr:alpha-glucan family phosphorylase [Verrucomicrobiota bacterium]
MKNIRVFNIVANLPEELSGLRTLAFNLWWSWDAEAIELFRRLDREMWRCCYHNPVRLLGQVDQSRLQTLRADSGFLAHLRRVLARMDRYMTEPTWFQKAHDGAAKADMAYFSLEFGIHECLPIYSGGLGVLAGDHLKSASDLGLPLVGFGLLYRNGYFEQQLNADGWQLEAYPDNDFYNMPISPALAANGERLKVTVDLPGRRVVAQVWHAQVGRVSLYLLDTNLQENPPADRNITSTLYGGDKDMRIRQEMLLGVGGFRALRALGFHPRVCHMNEGHAAFLALERVRTMMKEHELNFAEAREAVEAGTVFTTHTPVPAGIDVFHPDLVEHYFGGFRHELGLSRDQFLALGRGNPSDHGEGFNMAILALRTSAKRNGVSKLHGSVSRRMWRSLWPDLTEQEVPISHITNGVHTHSWLSSEMSFLFETYLGNRMKEEPTDASVWEAIREIPDAELWRTHERQRERLIAHARRHLRWELERRGGTAAEIAEAEEVLDPRVLTIGFARRFAGYKRATLLLKDPARLKRLVTNARQPVQFIFCGKAHPEDNTGKETIRQLVHFIRDPELRRHIIFIENYDVNIAHYMVQGSDVWLNNPRRPHEASGTSGMKATINGAINLSTVDGWWAEAASLDNGWSIGSGEEYADLDYQDKVECGDLFDLLEKEVVPLFYDRGPDGLPRHWIQRMKTSIRTIGPFFNSTRMVRDYVEQFYLPCADRFARLTTHKVKAARQLTAWKQHVAAHWGRIHISPAQDTGAAEVVAGQELTINITVALDGLKAGDISAQIVFGPLEAEGSLKRIQTVPMKPAASEPGNAVRFTGKIVCQASGRFGYAVRILPQHPDLNDPLDMRLVHWA